MNYLIIFLILVCPLVARANYAVGKPLLNQDPKCEVLLYTGLAAKVENHPNERMPLVLQILERDQTVNFHYQGWYSSHGSILTQFKSEQGTELVHDDFCADAQTIVPCFRYRGCAYRALAL